MKIAIKAKYFNFKILNSCIKINIKRADEFILFFLIFSSPIGFRFLPFGLVHITFIVGVIYLLVRIYFTRSLIVFDKVQFYFFLYVIYFVVDQILVNGSFKHALNLLISYLYFFLIVNIGIYIDRNRIICLFNKAISYLLLFFLVEVIYRYLHPGGGDFLHKFKENSLFFMDSNFVGLDLILLYFLLILIRNKRSGIYRKAVFIFNIFSLSRASIISSIFWKFIFKKIKNPNQVFKYAIIAIVLLVIFVIYFYDTLMTFDASLRSKFIFAEEAFNFIQAIPTEKILLWYGANSSIELFGHFLHNYVLVYVIDQGIIGLLLIFLFHYVLAKQTNGMWLIVFLPYLMAAMSVVSYASHVVYMAAGLVYLLFVNKNKIKFIVYKKGY